MMPFTMPAFVQAFLRRIKASVRFIIYFICIIVGIGGLGVWISLAQYELERPGASLGNLQNNLATLVIAISVTAFADYLVTKSTGDDRTTRLVLFVLTLLATAASICIFVIANPCVERVCTWTAAAVGAFVWIIVNWGHPNLVDSPPVAALGGTIS
jgi:hypothetical protein